jgi:hypothetical protein
MHNIAGLLFVKMASHKKKLCKVENINLNSLVFQIPVFQHIPYWISAAVRAETVSAPFSANVELFTKVLGRTHQTIALIQCTGFCLCSH